MGNIGSDPTLLDGDGADGIAGTEDDILYLSSSSPCIDAGDDSVVIVPTDLNGCTRIVDGRGDQTVRVDMGAYEYGACPLVSPAVERGGLVCGDDGDCTGAFAGSN